MSDTITLMVHFVAKADKIAELKEALLALITPTLKEPGCIAYELNQFVEEKEQFVFYEKWESHAHLDTHLKQSHVVEFRKKMEVLLFDLPTVNLTKPLSVSI